MKKIFETLPFNTSKIFARVYIQDSNCFLYVPAKNSEHAKELKRILHENFNPGDDKLIA